LNREPQAARNRGPPARFTGILRTGLFSGGGERSPKSTAALAAAGKKFMRGGGSALERATLIPRMAAVHRRQFHVRQFEANTLVRN